MPASKDKWDQKYAVAAEKPAAAKVLLENTHLLPSAGTALDFACGLGANAICLAQHGLSVSAWDISSVAIDRLNSFAKQQQLVVDTQVCDVTTTSLPSHQYDVIVVSYFLDRNLTESLIKLLKPKGLLFYQTYCQQKVEQIGPTNPDFLLADNELLSLFADLKLRMYREEVDIGDLKQGWRNQAMFIGQKV
jgi:2-polyprenyl-3-methyl-5-hydroxy-6-metoxy-1,4-benzoquinol methylase